MRVKTYPLSRKDRNEIALAWDGESYDLEGTFARTSLGDWAVRISNETSGKGAIVKVSKRNGESTFVILTMFEESSGDEYALYSFMKMERAVEIAEADQG